MPAGKRSGGRVSQHACGSRSRDGHRCRDLYPGGKCSQPCNGNLGFLRHAAKAFDPGIADTFQLGSDLFAADRREADGYALFSHRRLRSFR